MVKDITRIKVRLLIKAFLVMNRGKEVNSQEIADWINNNHFGLGQFSVNRQQVNVWIRGNKNQINSIFKELEIRKDGSYVFYKLPKEAK